MSLPDLSPFSGRSVVARQEDFWTTTIHSPPGTVPAGLPVTVEATLERVAPTGGPEPIDFEIFLNVNGVSVSRWVDGKLFQGESVTLSATLEAPGDVIQFGQNDVTFTGTQLDGEVRAGSFELVERPANVTSLTFNTSEVSPGNFFRATVIHRGNLDTAVSSTLVINNVDRDEDGFIVDETTVLADDVVSNPGKNEYEAPIRLNEMGITEELCAFLTDFGGT